MGAALDRAVELPNAMDQDRAHFALAYPFVAPANETEQRLVGIWEDVLAIGGLGINDDFFELGGDSLAAITLFTEIERAFGTKPPLSSLLERPTVRQLAGLLDPSHRRPNESPSGAVPSPLVAIRSAGNRPPLFLVHGGGGDVLFARGLLPFLDPEQPLYGITARGLVEGEIAHRNFGAMTADYLAGVRRVQPKGPYYLSGFCVGAVVAFEMAQRLREAGEKVAVVIKLDPDFNRVLTPWLYWRDPDALRVRLLRVFVGLAWQAWLLKQRLLGRGPTAEMALKPADDQRRYRAIDAGLRAAFKEYRPGAYDGKVAIFCSSERRKRLSNPITGWPAIAPNTVIVGTAPTHREFFRGALPELGNAIESVLASTQPLGHGSDQRAKSAAQ